VPPPLWWDGSEGIILEELRFQVGLLSSFYGQFSMEWGKELNNKYSIKALLVIQLTFPAHLN